MKKRLFALLAALSLLAGLTIPAGAMETATPPGESWRVEEDVFKEQYMTNYAARHREEYEAFDAEAYARETGWVNESMGEEEFRQEMWRKSLKLEDQAEKAFNAYIVEEYEKAYPGELEERGIDWALMIFGWESVEKMAAEVEYYNGDVAAARQYMGAVYVSTRQGAAYNHERTLEYRAQYPGSYEGYDPDYGYEGDWAYMKGNNMARYGLQNEVEWKEYMYVRYMPDGYLREQEQAAKGEEYPQRWPEEYAAFDPDAWFAGYYGILSLTPEAYMEQEGLDREAFKVAMFVEWADKSRNFFNGTCVTVDGTPIRFQFYRDLEGEVTGPRVEKERILIPLRAAAEALGLTVEWRQKANQVVCANEEKAVTFTLDSLEYSGGTLEAAPFAEKGITYLPLRALGETLGCGVEWKGDFATAALTTGK